MLQYERSFNYFSIWSGFPAVVKLLSLQKGQEFELLVRRPITQSQCFHLDLFPLLHHVRFENFYDQYLVYLTRKRRLVHNTIRNLNLKDTQFFSRAVASLFTSVPIDETINYIFDHILQIQIDLYLPVSKQKQSLFMNTYNIDFRFRGKIYR